MWICNSKQNIILGVNSGLILKTSAILRKKPTSENKQFNCDSCTLYIIIIILDTVSCISNSCGWRWPWTSDHLLLFQEYPITAMNHLTVYGMLGIEGTALPAELPLQPRPLFLIKLYYQLAYFPAIISNSIFCLSLYSQLEASSLISLRQRMLLSSGDYLFSRRT